jgi:hypothetical protein
MCDEKAQRTMKCDVFSFGLVLYEMVVGKPVFDPAEGALSVVRRLPNVDLPEVPAEAGAVMVNLIRKCWERYPKDRPSFQQIFEMMSSCRFDILPGAEPVEISNFSADVLRWTVFLLGGSGGDHNVSHLVFAPPARRQCSIGGVTFSMITTQRTKSSHDFLNTPQDLPSHMLIIMPVRAT